MTDHNDDTSLTEITVTDTIIAQQNKLIAQLMQQIVDMKREMRKTQELANLAITANLPDPGDERPPFPFHSPDPSHQPVPISTNPPITPVQALPVINLTTSDEGPSNIFSQNPHNAQAGGYFHIAHTLQP
ncbi:hypothetical protein L3055_11250 [Corynebacterium sp. MC-02]|nr:hypothetical protein [Corynebacterium pseudokroppenstedtii]MCF8704102.1 hypothetical protein [Corynebacterium pseudokroppenstedtii]